MAELIALIRSCLTRASSSIRDIFFIIKSLIVSGYIATCKFLPNFKIKIPTMFGDLAYSYKKVPIAERKKNISFGFLKIKICHKLEEEQAVIHSFSLNPLFLH